jgi:hypothetical protein
MFADQMQIQGISSRISYLTLLTFRSRRSRAMTALSAISCDDGTVGDPLPLCHSERWRSGCDGERGTPRMFADQMQIQGISSRISYLTLLTFRSRRCRAMTAISAIPSLCHSVYNNDGDVKDKRRRMRLGF